MISPRWRKVVRDLWANKSRTVMVVLAIAVGIFAFASVFITGDVLVADMNSQYGAINASSITLFTDAADEGPARWALRQPEVVDAQMRDWESVKLVTSGSTYNMNLLVYNNYNRITVNRITPERGTWPPGRREILLERTTASFIGAKIGEPITVELPNGIRYKLTLAGTVHDLNAVPANLFPELSGYVTMETIAYMGLPAMFSRLEIVAQPEYQTVEQLDGLAQDLSDRLRRAGVATEPNFQVRTPGEHWGRDTTESFTLILSVIGIFSLLLSGFLVVNTMSALMLEQRRQIGMMKAIGGTGRQIIGMYLALVTSYGLMALIIAVPVGLGLAYLFVIAVTGFLNLDILAFHLPVSVLALQVVAAVIVPAIAAAIPLRGGMKITVREALSTYGIKSKERQGWLDVLALRVQRLPRVLILSLRNTFRRKGRLLLTMGTLTLAGILFIGVVNVRASLMQELDNILDSLFNYEVQIYYNDSYPAAGAQQRAEGVPGVLETGSLTNLRAQRIKADGSAGSSFNIIGISPGGDFIRPQIIEGRWLNSTDRNAVVITSRLAKDMPDLRVGETVVLKTGEREQRWKVVGVMLMAFDSVGYASFDYVSGLNGSPGMASSILVRTDRKDSAAQETVGKAVETRLKDAGIGVAYSLTKDTIASSNASQFDFLVSFLLSMAAMVAVIGGLGLAGMMGLSVMERTREIGVMRSIGASNGAVAGIVITEGLIIGLISWLLAIPLSIPFSIGFDAILGQAFLDNPLLFVFTGTGPLTWLLIVAVIAVIASLLPARRAVRMSVRETLAYE